MRTKKILLNSLIEQTSVCESNEFSVGYCRFEGEQSLRLMQELYEVYGCLVNYFFPSMKIILKARIDNKLIIKYDRAEMPYGKR